MGLSRRKLNQLMVAPIPRCFHRDYDAKTPHRRSRSAAVIRLVKSDGMVAIYDTPVTASELMEEFPKHMVCRSDCFYIGQVTPALSHHDRLLPGHNYFLLPANFFQSALSFATFLRCRTAAAGPPPFELEKTAAGGLRVKVTEEMIVQRQKEMEAEAEVARRIVRVCTTPQLRKDYEMLVGRRLQWKPKLDSISEQKSRKILRKTKSNVV
ncbi:hypothetical protein SASPL_110896 [Salvia splendens]|uniref:Uncharacterized protein n=1 Tax=Salvia splendens TaxID=180675 RepID=A0A8X8Y8I8_SALSN|nr:uncharacterized protein LOC121800612 [Salvia splendens]KAG6426669.1 hypothetical protein SASPL_110896 [Salvia splendens]